MIYAYQPVYAIHAKKSFNVALKAKDDQKSALCYRITPNSLVGHSDQPLNKGVIVLSTNLLWIEETTTFSKRHQSAERPRYRRRKKANP